MAHTKTGIYAIVDKVADNIIGGLQLHRHDAPAVRVFLDAARTTGTLVNQHTGDFMLVRLGYLNLQNQIEEDYAIILEGETLATTQEKPDTGDTVERDKPALSSRR